MKVCPRLRGYSVQSGVGGPVAFATLLALKGYTHGGIMLRTNIELPLR